MASKLLEEVRLVGALPQVRLASPPAPSMERGLQSRFVAVCLVLLSAAAIAFAWINFNKDREYIAPYDGVWWVESGGHLRAQRVDVDGPGQKAGIKEGDQLIAVDTRNIANVGSLERQLYRVGVWSKATYSLIRQGVPVEAPLILAPVDRSLFSGERLIALVYLCIGIYVLLTALDGPQEHALLRILPGFVRFLRLPLHGKFNDFDWIIYWSNVCGLAAAAGAVPALRANLSRT